MPPQPSRCEIWVADLNPVRGHEQAGTRPVLVVSTDALNHGPSQIVFVVPLTRTGRRNPFYISIDPPEWGVRDRSYVICTALRAVSTDRLQGLAWGMVSRHTMATIEDRLRILLEL